MSELNASNFSTMAQGYGLLQDFEVHRSSDRIVLTLKPINWIYGIAKTAFLAILQVGFIYYCWLANPEPIAYLPCSILVFLVAAWPLYIPILRRRWVKLPILEIDLASEVIRVSASDHTMKLSELYAVCDVMGPNGDGDPNRHELQLALTSPNGIQFVLVAKSLCDIFPPIAREIAAFTRTCHVSVDIQKATIKSTPAPNSKKVITTNHPMDRSGGSAAS